MSETIEKKQRPDSMRIEQLQITSTAPETEKLDFEGSLAELEKVVAELDGEVKLDRALELFNRGMKLSSDCQTFLQSAEQQVEILKRSVDGSLSTLPFVDEDETNDQGRF